MGLKFLKLTNVNFKMVSGYGIIIRITKIKVKMFNLIRRVYVFVLDNDNFSHDFLIGLDLIKEFKICQDENLNIYQKLNGKGIFCSSDILKSDNLACINFV